jgi:hypothetical protein
MRIDSSGRLLLGTTTEGYSSADDLTIATSGHTGITLRSGTTSEGAVYFSDATTGGGEYVGSLVYTHNTNAMIFTANGTEAMRILADGKLLLGTTSDYDGYKFQVESSSYLVASFLRYGSDGAYLNLGSSRGTQASKTALNNNEQGGLIQFTAYDGSDFSQLAAISAWTADAPTSGDTPGDLVFSVTADNASSVTERMRLNSSGELLIGYTSDNGAYKLQVNSQIFATSATVATSDGNYKENVSSLTDCLNIVDTLNPVSFTWKEQQDVVDSNDPEKVLRPKHNFPTGKQVGFIAQEVQTALDGKDYLGSIIKENSRQAVVDDDGNEITPKEDFLGIAEGNLTALLVGAIKELKAENVALKARLDNAGL